MDGSTEKCKVEKASRRVHDELPRFCDAGYLRTIRKEGAVKGRTIAVLVFIGACSKSTTEEPAGAVPVPVNAPASTVAAGATPRAALDAFLGAVKAQDLQAMSLAWGDKDGAVRDSKKLTREDVESREIVLMRCLRYDKYRVLSESAAANNERVMSVELTSGTQTRVTDFFTARGADRWYLRWVQQPCPTK
jgi:hypothetical protein